MAGARKHIHGHGAPRSVASLREKPQALRLRGRVVGYLDHVPRPTLIA